MARLIDLQIRDGTDHETAEAGGGSLDEPSGQDERDANPNVGLFSAALTCYP